MVKKILETLFDRDNVNQSLSEESYKKETTI